MLAKPLGKSCEHPLPLQPNWLLCAWVSPGPRTPAHGSHCAATCTPPSWGSCGRSPPPHAANALGDLQKPRDFLGGLSHRFGLYLRQGGVSKGW